MNAPRKRRLEVLFERKFILDLACSPVKYEKKALEMIGRKLKKNSVSLDVVSFGEDEEGKEEKLEALVSGVNNNDSSHLVHVPPGPSALCDALISSPVFSGDGEGGSGFAAAAAAGAVSGFDFGVDPSIDPELALALRVSRKKGVQGKKQLPKRLLRILPGRKMVGKDPVQRT